ncbi:MAG TPA: metalloregulator ArsR/SmtB family transcription factor [Ktedonobacterales bacterium]|jgi:DNA-binding transcriptional ArsR family regulator|nr:metalloregulator ArsR/SmtB family transcription factor [Ktedonobacterales bacterium]
MVDGSQRLIALTQALADPLRLEILRELMGGPATVSELTALTGATQPNVSNHLALLRERGLVRATREGRQMRYDVQNPAVASLIEALVSVAGAPARRASERVTPPLARARLCYDHLAGEVGVALFDALVARDALRLTDVTKSTARAGRAAPSAMVELGPAGAAIFGDLGVSVAEAQREKRRFAYPCVDWTERRPHLGGALGAALCAAAVARGWVARQPATRAVIVTDAGWQALRERFGVDLASGPSDDLMRERPQASEKIG